LIEWLRGVEQLGFIGHPLNDLLVVESSVSGALTSLGRIFDI